MNISWTTIGHKLPKQYLNNAIANDRLAQAYLFAGPGNIGKSMLALDLAAFLLKKEGRTKLNSADPDFILIDQAEEIKIAQIREMKRKLWLKSMTGGKKVVIIAGAEKLNRESSNAFLKILEEPSGDTVFILTTAVPGKLPTTVLSRTQKLFFALNLPEELQEFINSKSIQDNLKNTVFRLSFGRIGLASKLMHNEEALQEFLSWKGDFENILKGDTSANLISSSEFAKSESLKLVEMLNFWLMLAEDKFAELIPVLDSSFKAFVFALDPSLKDLDRNLNKKLVLDNLFLQT